jgi:hypothetical protein
MLAIGNYLNTGTPRGGAYGFKVYTTITRLQPSIRLIIAVLHVNNTV